MTRTPRSVGGCVASATKLRKKMAKAHKGTIIGTGNAGAFAPVLLALAATTQPAQALQPVPRLDDARAFPPLVPRGTIAVATLRGKYGARKTYDFSDIVSLAQRIEKKEVTLIDIKKDKSHEKFKVPYSTMRDWLKDDALVMEKKGKRGVSGTPHWKVERDVRRRTELSKPGPGPVLGAGKKALIVKMADAANRGMPFSDEEIGDVLRDSAIKLKLKHPSDGKPYTLKSDVRSLTAGFLRRADEAGITFENKEGRSFARVRANSATMGILVKYRDDVVEPALALFQREQKVTLGLEDIINFDEAMLDLNDFALGNAYFLQNFGNNVVTPWERAPHITVVTGFAGRVHLVVLMIFKGPTDKPPHPAKAQLLTGATLYIAQSESGWITTKLKNEFFDLQVNVVTGLDHLNELKAAQAERLAKADKAATKKREFWENHRKKIRAAQARLVEKKTPSKLKVSEQAALILDRTGHHTKLNSKKRDPAGDTLICAELRRVMNDPSLLPATPVADDSDASEVPEPADEGSCPCGTTPMAGAAYCHACGRQL